MVIAKHARFVTLLLTAAIGASASAAHLDKQQVDAIVSRLITEDHCKGVAVGLIDPTGREVFGYGRTRDGGVVPDGKTVFEIGSVSKTFTSTLLAEMVQDGEVRLDQPVKELLPPDVHVPEKDGVSITLAHLATQRSGLPRMPDNFEPADSQRPYVDYTTQKLYEALASIKLSRKPGESAEYSNLGVGLLGHALALKSGKSYEQLLVERICKPLGMNDTRVTLDENLKSRLAAGHQGAMEVPNWDFIDPFVGAGGIRSTADDMLIYLAAELGPGDSPLTRAMKTTQEQRASAGKVADIGLAWFIGRRTGAHWHDGGTGGYTSFVSFVPDKKVGVVLLVNSMCGDTDLIGTQLTEALLGEKVEPVGAATTTRSAD